MSLRTEIRWVAVITAAALLLRWIQLNSGLWIDEIYSLLASFRPPLQQIVTMFPRDNHHPLYSALAHLSLAGFGESPWTIRLPSLLFGTATIPLLYLLARSIAGRREALMAGVLLAVSYHHVWFSQNARGYVLLAAFTVAATLLLLRMLEGGGRAAALGYAAVAALGAYTHLMMVFVVVGHALVGVVLLVLPRRRAGYARVWPGLLLAFGLAALLTLLIYAPMLPQIREYFVNRPSRLRGVSTPGWAALESVRVLAQGFGAGSLALGIPALAAAAVLFGIGFGSYARRNPLALGLFTAPAGVIIAGALVARGTMYPRFFFALMPFGILIGVRGVAVTAEWIARRTPGVLSPGARAGRLAGGIVAAMVLLSLASLRTIYRYPKQDFIGALSWLEAHRAPGELVATTGATVLPYREYLGRDWPEVATAAELGRLRRGRAVWLIYTFPRYLARSAPEISAIADTQCRRATVFRGTVGGGDILVCRLEPVA